MTRLIHPLQPIKNSLMKTLVLQDLILYILSAWTAALLSIGNGLERHDSSPLGVDDAFFR